MAERREDTTGSGGFSHVDEAGRARMVDVSPKSKVKRTARAEAVVLMAPGTVELIRRNGIQKGDVLTVAKIAGILAAKRTPELIPLCHTVGIDQIDLELRVSERGVEIESRAVCVDRTGIEMEALTAASVAALTIYDMCKAVDREMTISGIRLIEKTKEALR